MPNTTTIQGPGPCTGPDKCSCSSGNSGGPIRFFTGRILMTDVDIDMGISGFSHQRTFLNRNYELDAWNSVQGWNWGIDEWPYLVQRVRIFGSTNVESIVLKQGLSPLWFNRDSTTGIYTCRYGNNSTNFLEHIPAEGIYRYTNLSGNSVAIIDFQDFTHPTSLAGMMKRRVDSNGFETAVMGYGDKCITSLETIRGGKTYRLLYSYLSSGAFLGKINTVSMEIQEGSEIKQVRRCRYLYHSGATSEGLLGDLKAAIKQQPVTGSSPVAWEDTAVRYYRYGIQPVGNDQRHLLKVVVGPTMYMLLKQAGQDVLTMIQSSGGVDLVPQFANNMFYYDDYNRVVKEVARGEEDDSGSEGWTYSRIANPNAPRNQSTPSNALSYNTWYWKIIEEGRAGLRKIIYTNKIGQPLAQISEDNSNSSQRWIDVWLFDENGNSIIHASPSAVAIIDETLPDLVGMRPDGTFSGLKANIGLIERTIYYTTTTATSSVAGGVKNYLRSTFVQKGYAGSWIPKREISYIASDNLIGVVTYALASETVFKLEEDSSASRITTSYVYVWTLDTRSLPRILQKITTWPLVPLGEGGDGVGDTRKEYYDSNGNLIWEMDERGIITKREYDVSRGLLLKITRDVGSVPTPPGWPITAGSHFEQETEYLYDDLGRQIEKIGDRFSAIVNGDASFVRSIVYNAYVDAPLSDQALFGPIVLNQIREAAGYFLDDDSTQLIDPVTIEMFDKCGRKIQTVVSARSTGSGALSASDTFLREKWSRWETFFYNERGRPAGKRVYYKIPDAMSGLEGVSYNTGVLGDAYDESFVGYETTRNLVIRSVGPEGTIQRRIYNILGQLLELWVGTVDASVGETWENWAPGTPETNMVLTFSRQYDNGQSGGDSLVTMETNWLTDSFGRSSRFSYDFQGRMISEAGEEESFFEYAYDNLDRRVSEWRRSMDASGTLVGFSETLYNARNQIFELRRYAVNPESGTVGNYLAGNQSYDPAGNLLEVSSPGAGGRTTWMQYDNLGRRSVESLGYWNNTSSPIVAVMMEKKEFNFDAASNIIQVILGQVDSGVSASSPTYRYSYAFNWYDPLNRLFATANLGALNAIPARPTEPLDSSPTVLASFYSFNDRGELFSEIDSLGREKRSSFDDEGRLVEAIDHYVAPGIPSLTDTGINQIARYAYTPDGQVRLLTAVFAPANSSQVTTYVFGSTLIDSGIASNKLLRQKIYADGSFEDFTYNRQQQKISFADANGTVHEYGYDRLGRLLHDRAVALGERITTALRRISLSYDIRGLVQKVTSASSIDVSQPFAINEVRRNYDDFGYLIKEFQEHAGAVDPLAPEARFVLWTRHGGNGNTDRLESIRYPSGREYVLGYGDAGGIDDSMDRTGKVSERVGITLQERVNYGYLGTARPVRVVYPQPDVLLDLWGGTVGVYEGLDSFGRVVDQRWRKSSADLVRLKYDYDMASQQLNKRDTVANWLGKKYDELYNYDGLDQVKGLNRGILNTSGTALEVGSQTFFESFGYDSLGNWDLFISGNPVLSQSQAREHNSVNEIVRLDTGNTGWWAKPRYDSVGNTTRVPRGMHPNEQLRIDYDAWNRPEWIHRYDAVWGKKRVVRYAYDGLSRKITELSYRTEDPESGKFSERLDFYYDDQWRVVEKYSYSEASAPRPLSVGTLKEHFLWTQALGDFADNLVLRERPSVSSERFYVLQDIRRNTAAVVDQTGNVLERYTYSAFGLATFLDASFVPISGTAYSWNLLFAAKPRNTYTGLDDVRYRLYSPDLGRWITRDPINESGGINLYVAGKNDLVNKIDVMGLLSCKLWTECAGTEMFDGQSEWELDEGSVSYKTEGTGPLQLATGVTAKFTATVKIDCKFKCKEPLIRSASGERECTVTVDFRDDCNDGPFPLMNPGSFASPDLISRPKNAPGTAGSRIAKMISLPKIPTQDSYAKIKKCLNTKKPKEPSEGSWSDGTPCKKLDF